MTKAMIGTAIMTAAFMASMSFGDDDDEPLIEITANGYGAGQFKKNYVLKETGWLPYSFRIRKPGGGYWPWINYQYTPLNVGLGFIGNIRDAQKYKKEKVDMDAFAAWTIAFSLTYRAVLDMTFISSLNDVLSVAMNPQDDDTMDAFAKGLAGTAKAVVVPNLYNQVFKQIQEFSDMSNKQVKDTYFGEFLKSIPVVRNKYNDMLNGLGEPVVPRTDKFISSGSAGPLWDLIVEKDMTNLAVPSKKTLSLPDPEALDKFKPNEDYFVKDRVLRDARTYKKFAKVYTVLDDDEYYDFCHIRGNYIKLELQKAIDANATNELDAKWMTNTQRDATAAALKEIMNERDEKFYNR